VVPFFYFLPCRWELRWPVLILGGFYQAPSFFPRNSSFLLLFSGEFFFHPSNLYDISSFLLLRLLLVLGLFQSTLLLLGKTPQLLTHKHPFFSNKPFQEGCFLLDHPYIILVNLSPHGEQCPFFLFPPSHFSAGMPIRFLGKVLPPGPTFFAHFLSLLPFFPDLSLIRLLFDLFPLFVISLFRFHNLSSVFFQDYPSPDV